MEKACTNCPLELALNSAESLIDDASHSNTESTRGGIALTKLCFGKILTDVICNGSTINSDGQKVCPLRDLTMFTRSLAFAPWPTANFEVDLKKLGGASVQKVVNNNGMYL